MGSNKIRALKRKWSNMITNFNLKLGDSNLDEVFIDESFPSQRCQI